MNVGDYVRTKDGIIQKITDVFNTSMEIATDRGQRIYHYINIVKSSPQIIDLIEAGDYINGLRVEKNKYGELYTSYVYYGGDIGKQCEVYTTWLKEYTEDMIYEVVTHEQMEAMQYRVEE